jgi:iron-sulfur cluster assembly protein
MIYVSEKAKSRIQQIAQDDSNPDQSFIRVSVIGGGCSGLSYDLNFDKSQDEGDKIFEDNGVKIIVQSALFFSQLLNFAHVGC